MIVFQQEGQVQHEDKIYLSEYYNGTWTHPASLNDFLPSPPGNVRNFRAEMSSNGNVLIVYSVRRNLNVVLYKSERFGGVWSHDQDLTDNFTFDDSSVEVYKIAISNNFALVGWVSDSLAVFKSEYSNNSWEHPLSYGEKLTQDSIRFTYYNDWDNAIDVDINNIGKGIIEYYVNDIRNNNKQIDERET